jgi:Taurine catabolism dioxygenase TauD, TfdA family
VVGQFRTFDNVRRVPAVPMQAVIDPAGWSPEDFGAVATWSYRISERDVEELANAVALVRRQDIAIEQVGRDNFPLDGLADVLVDVRRELTDGRGMVMLQNFPIERFDRQGVAIAYLGIGSYLGTAISQNRQGHILGHVKDLGGNYADLDTRGYTTRAEMLFHADASDYVGLLCLHGAKSGGESRVASSVTVYNRILQRRPDLAKVLCEDFYRSHSGEVNPGGKPYFTQPIFSFTQGYFSATGAGAAIDKAQRLPGVPPYTDAQKEAVALYRKTVDECAVDIAFEPGDIQFLNNFVTLHTRREYQDWSEEGRKRHLLRLWLSDPQGRPIPKEQRQGRSGRGVHLKDVKLVAPLDVSAAA